MALVAVGGCGGGSKKPSPVPPAKAGAEKKAEPQIVHTEGGEATRLSPGNKRVRRWTVRWKSAELEVSAEGNVHGGMKSVSGTIYRDGQPASDFSADSASAPSDSEDLFLSGHVRIVARKPVSSLHCDELVWRPGFNRVEAKGNVRMDLPPWQMGVLPVLWADPDLKEAATPDMFRRKEHGRSK